MSFFDYIQVKISINHVDFSYELFKTIYFNDDQFEIE